MVGHRRGTWRCIQASMLCWSDTRMVAYAKERSRRQNRPIWVALRVVLLEPNVQEDVGRPSRGRGFLIGDCEPSFPRCTQTHIVDSMDVLVVSIAVLANKTTGKTIAEPESLAETVNGRSHTRTR